MMQPDHELYTYHYLYKITNTSPAFIQQMISLFITSLDEYIIELANLRKEKNLPELKKVLHKMKPGVMNLEVKGAGEILKLVSESGSWNKEIEDGIFQLIDIFIKIKPMMEKDLIELSKVS